MKLLRYISISEGTARRITGKIYEYILFSFKKAEIKQLALCERNATLIVNKLNYTNCFYAYVTVALKSFLENVMGTLREIIHLNI